MHEVGIRGVGYKDTTKNSMKDQLLADVLGVGANDVDNWKMQTNLGSVAPKQVRIPQFET